MLHNTPKLIQTYLLDGTLEGVKIIELSGSGFKAFVTPRLKLQDIKNRKELQQPSLYFLISGDESLVYVGECENFYHRIKNHDQSKDFWDVAIAFVSNDNTLEKSDVKYLEYLAVERAREGSVDVLNKTVPARNTIHEFKLHILNQLLDDAQLITSAEGYDILSSPGRPKQTWYCNTKKTKARAEFRGDKFVVLAGSTIDKSHTKSLAATFPKAVAERVEIFKKYGKSQNGTVLLQENVSFKSPNHAGGFVTGRYVNAWTTWKDGDGRTMDEVMRKG